MKEHLFLCALALSMTACMTDAPKASPDTPSARTVAAPPVAGPIAGGQRLLDLKVKDDATLVQRRLIDFGHLLGKADGDFGKASRAALARYKKTIGLPADAEWDTATQKALFRNSGM